MACKAPNCTKVIPRPRRQRYPNAKTCSTACEKKYRKAYAAQWVRLYLKKKADLWGDPRWETVRQYAAAGQWFEAAQQDRDGDQEGRRGAPVPSRAMKRHNQSGAKRPDAGSR